MKDLFKLLFVGIVSAGLVTAWIEYRSRSKEAPQVNVSNSIQPMAEPLAESIKGTPETEPPSNNSEGTGGAYGYMNVKTVPSSECVLEGNKVKATITTPLSRKRMPAGQYTIHCNNRMLGLSARGAAVVSEDKFTNIELKLEAK